MRFAIGTKSLLFGSHQFLLHPLFVAVAWRRLYKRWPRDPRIWLAFVIHDWGYWGLPNLDGTEGEAHPLWAANWLGRRFDRGQTDICWQGYWWRFAAGHSRTFAAFWDIPTSPLMRADKLATALYPNWLYVALCWLSGEWVEYAQRWRATGTYPGKDTDGVSEFCRHLQDNFQRFRSLDAHEGGLFSGE